MAQWSGTLRFYDQNTQAVLQPSDPTRPAYVLVCASDRSQYRAWQYFKQHQPSGPAVINGDLIQLGSVQAIAVPVC